MIPDYYKMLEEAYKELEKMGKLITTIQDRINIPLPKVSYHGKWTVIENSKEISDILNRDIELLSLFLQKEFGIAGKIEGNNIILQKRITFEEIKKRIDKFVEIFVRCPICKKLDTKLIKEDRIYYIKCMACGALSPIQYKLK